MQNNYIKYLKEFIKSKEMIDYLSEPRDSVSNIADIIFCSPTPIEKKLNALKELLSEVKVENDEQLVEDCNKHIKRLEKGLYLLEQEGVFTVERGYFDIDKEEKICEFETIVSSYKYALDYINVDKEYDKECGHPVWYVVTGYEKDSKGKFDITCSAYVKDGEILFIELDTVDSLYDSENLNLPVPFKAGDIVKVDGYPFSIEDYYLITSIGDNRDCCCLQAVHFDRAGNMTKGAVKHCMVGKQEIPNVSMLYSMETYSGTLREHQKGYHDIQDIIMWG